MRSCAMPASPAARAGGVSRLDEMQAAILSAQLPKLGVDNVKRLQIASAYTGSSPTRR
jgi:dTDP-4-amino-4,6-dideoxygalactose transaminase